jgi:hypothetical protein
MSATSFPPTPYLDLLDRIWAVRDNVSAYIGMYIALAQATLVSCDAALGPAPGHIAPALK